MRRKELRKKEASKVNKAKQHSTPKAVMYKRIYEIQIIAGLNIIIIHFSIIVKIIYKYAHLRGLYIFDKRYNL